MLYEMITGRQPFDGEVPIQVAYQHVNSAVQAPSAQVPGLAAEIDELVQWCTDKDPDKRPVDGNALLSELRHIRTNLSDAELDLQPPAAVRSLLAALGAPPDRPPGAAVPASDAQDTAYVQPPTEMPVELPTELPTEIYGSFQQPTETISRNNGNPTTVMSGAPLRPAYGPLSTPEEVPYEHAPYHGTARYDGAGYDDAGDVAAPPSKRAQRKLDRDEEKARQRAAATPTKTLHEGNPRRRGLLWIVLLVVAALLAAAAGWFFGMGPGSPGTIPPVANKTVAEAQDLLRTAGFQSTVKDVFDDDVSPGLVVGTEPTAGEVIRKFQPVSLAVSKGPELFPLPELTGKTLDEAKTTLNGAEMALGPITETFDETAPAGTVLAQAPRSGNPAKHGTPVALTVSKGPQPIPVPDVRGQAQDAAVSALEAAGLKAVVAPEPVNDRNIPKGAVLAQDPASGNLTKGGSVTLTISKGPKYVEVPSVFRKSEAEAVQALKNAGFDVKVTYAFGASVLDIVAGQDKTGQQPEGSLITITVT